MASLDPPMLTSWLLRSSLLRPGAGLLLLLALGAWPMARQLDALSLLSHAEDWSALALEGGALLALLAASLGVASLGRYRDLLERISPGKRIAQEAAFLLLLVVGVQLVGGLGMLIERPSFGVHEHAGHTHASSQNLALGPIGLGVRLALVDMHLTALALLVSRLALRETLRPALLVLLAWVLPALLVESSLVPRLALQALAPASLLAGASDATETLVSCFGVLSSSVALLLLAMLPSMQRSRTQLEPPGR